MKFLKLDRLPWIDISPYDQILTDLISSCQQRDVSLICVQGPNGSGKSRILTELLSTLSFDATASLIALSGNDNEVFYHNVELSSNLLDIKDEKFLNNFTLTLEAILQDKQHFYILIDDVEALSYDLMLGITTVISENPAFKQQVTLVVFMGVTPIHIETRRLFRGAEMITLKGMTISQAKQFIDQAHRHAHYDKELSMSEVNQLHSLSYGYVGRLIKLLENSLAQPSKRHILKYWMLFGIPLLLVLIFLWYNNSGQPIENVDHQISEDEIIVDPILVKKEVVPVKIVLPIPDSQVTVDHEIIALLPEQTFSGPMIPEMENEDESSDAFTQLEQTTKILPDDNHIEISENPDKKTVYNYVIELGRNHSKVRLQSQLKGRSIPGKAQFKQIDVNGSKIWIAYIGPYGSEQQATQGKEKLPASLQSLPLKVRKEF